MASKVDQVLTAVQAQGVTLSAVKQRLDDDHERIFGGPGQEGALKYLALNDEKISAALAAATKDFKEALEVVKKDVNGVKAEVTEIKTKQRVQKAYVAGGVAAGSALGWIIKAGLLKVGVHIP